MNDDQPSPRLPLPLKKVLSRTQPNNNQLQGSLHFGGGAPEPSASTADHRLRRVGVALT